jgi:hypothetical protein
METNLKIYYQIGHFDPIVETSQQQLTGGFSTSVTVSAGVTFAVDDNNCNGANCTSGCGSGQNLISCNTRMGCGGNFTMACG